MLDPGLEDKVVLITGANHGIGAARAFAVQGAALRRVLRRSRLKNLEPRTDPRLNSQ